MITKQPTLEEEVEVAASTVVKAFLNSFIFPRHDINIIESWLTQRIMLMMLNQMLRNRPREVEAYTAGYEQGYADAKAGRMADNSLKHE